jgi:LPXTG-site transpeptidase (sortase) family protein
VRTKRKKQLKSLLNIYTFLGILLWVIAGIFIFTPVFPQIYYGFFPTASANELNSLTQAIDQDTDGFKEITNKYDEIEEEEQKDDRPTLDEKLTKQNTLKISRIGINAPIQQGRNSKKELQEGPWLVYGFGVPDTHLAPIIIASHRWGALGWNSAQRKSMSFLRLPEVKVGDTIQIIWEQRLYKYEIYKSTEDTKITDYDADLILYTCKLYWESPIRIFKYAKRIN